MARNRTFRVFISSTFEDFQTERELLRERVYPELENFCKLHGATFEAIDLRWGIPANSAEDLDIVSICLDEVERCRKLSPRPNFVALIGNRYGWRPLPATIPINIYDLLPVSAKEVVTKHYNLDKNAIPETYLINKKSITAEENENSILQKIRSAIDKSNRLTEFENYFFKSATHLEIEEGIFNTKLEDIEDHFFACFRHIDDFEENINDVVINQFTKKFIDLKDGSDLSHDAEAEEWLNQLKDDIRKKLTHNQKQIGEYHTNLEDLSTQKIMPYMENMCVDIENWLKEMIIEELTELNKVDELQAEILEHRNFRDARNQTFGGREILLNEIKKKCEIKKTDNIICIHGEGGSGKSALLSKLISNSETEFPHSRIVYRFIGATPKSVELNSLLGSIVDEIDSIKNSKQRFKRNSREEHVAAFNNCLSDSETNENFIIFIDALDQLSDTENARSLYWLPKTISDNFIVIFSVLNGPVYSSFRNIYPEAENFDLSPQKLVPDTAETEAMLNALLSKKPARKLQPFQTNHIVQAFTKNPLMLNLKLIAENARHWHSFDSISDIDEKNIGIKDNVTDQIKSLFYRLSQDDNHGEVFVKNVISFIALSREGASDKEIKEMLWLDEKYLEEFNRRKHANQPDVDSLPPIVWSRFFFEIQPFVMERTSGNTVVLDFFHRIFKEVVQSVISQEETLKCHQLFDKHFSDEKTNPVRFITQSGDVLYNTRKLTELPFHQTAAGSIGNVYKTLIDFIFIDSKVKTGKAYELMEDFQQAISLNGIEDHPLLILITKALRNDINFIARHPDTLFQCLFNSCWWHDHPGKIDFLKEPIDEFTNSNNKLYALMEEWEKTKATIEPGFYWLKSLQPPSVELDGPQIGLLTGLSSPVTFVSYSDDGDRIFGVCNRGELITWNTNNRNIEQFLPFDHEKSFMFKPNSKTRFDEKTEIMSDRGGVLADHPGFEYWAWCGNISNNGKLFLSGSFNGEVTLWEFSQKGNQSYSLEIEKTKYNRPVRGMAFSGDNNFAAIGHGDGSVNVWDLINKKRIAEFTHDEGWVNSVTVNKDCSKIVSAGGDGILYLWEKSNDKYQLTKLNGHTDRVWSVTISKDGNYAASGSDDKTVRIWNLDSKKEIKCLKGHSRWVQALAFNNKGSILASSGGDGKIILWDADGNSVEPMNQYLGHDDSVLSLSFSKDDKFLLSASRDQSVRIWDVQTKFAARTINGHSDRIICAAYSSNGQYLVTGSNDKTIRLWSASSGSPVNDSIDCGASISSLKISPDNKFIILGTDNGEIIIVDLNTFSILERFNFHDSRIYSLDISSDAKLVLSTSHSGEIKLWHLRTFEILAQSIIPNESILSVSISPGNNQFVCGTRNGSVKLFNINRDKNKSHAFSEVISKSPFKSWVDETTYSTNGKRIEARGGSWDDRKIVVMDSANLNTIDESNNLPDGAIGSFGKYRLGFGNSEIIVKDLNGIEEIAWYPKSLEFTTLHNAKRQWAGVQRYNLHHFRLEGGR
jgi:WD40 repeat protein